MLVDLCMNFCVVKFYFSRYIIYLYTFKRYTDTHLKFFNFVALHMNITEILLQLQSVLTQFRLD